MDLRYRLDHGGTFKAKYFQIYSKLHEKQLQGCEQTLTCPDVDFHGTLLTVVRLDSRAGEGREQGWWGREQAATVMAQGE